MRKLQRKIMQGIYYAYLLRLVSLPGVFQGFCMLGIMIVLSRFVSLTHVYYNIISIRVGQLDTFLYNAVSTTEVWTLLLIGLFVFFMLSLRLSFISAERMQYSFARI
jgi:hypothetical protein